MAIKLSKEEKEWRARDDARTLMEAETIKNDSSRKKAAINAAKQIIKDREKEVSAIKKVIKPGGSKRKR